MATIHELFGGKFKKALLISLLSLLAVVTMLVGTNSNAKADAYNLNNMSWGLLPAGDPKNAGGPATYSAMYDTFNHISPMDWSPDADDHTNGIVTTGENANSITKPYVVADKTPKIVVGGKDNYNQSTAKIGDTINQLDGSTFKATGFRIGPSYYTMGVVTGKTYPLASYSAERGYFNFQVEEITKSGTIVSNSGVQVYNPAGSSPSTILGFDKMSNPDNDLVRVTITPTDSATGQLFTGKQVLYFSLKGTNNPNSKPQPTNIGYGLTQPNGNIGMRDMVPNTRANPIIITIPSDGIMTVSDLNNPDALWTADNAKLTLTKITDDAGYKVTGLKSLPDGTIVKYTITQIDGTTSDFYFKFNVANGGGGNGGGGNNNGGGGSSTITTPTTPTQPATPGPTTPTTPPAKHETNSSSPSAPEIKLPNYASVKNSAVYAVNPIYMYKHATFKKSQRIAKYPKATRVNRPMFVITGYARSNNGALRYKVRDVNHGKKTAGKVGYITANPKYVVNVYYKTMPKNKKITVIAKNVHAYKNQNLTGRTKTYKKGTHLTVKKLVKHNLTSRYQLSNGYYVTANKKLVIQGNY